MPTFKPIILLYLLISTAVALCFAEGVLRLLGYETWHVGKLGSKDIQVDGNMRYSVVDSVLGHRIMPGRIDITMPTGLKFSATHLANLSRATHASIRGKNDKEIWTLGCSFTYGWAVDDSGSYPWKLQVLVPEYEVINFGVSGYGTLQSLMLFERILKTLSPPRIAILGYVPWHEERNYLTRSWKKNLSAYKELSFMEHPFGTLNEGGDLRIDKAPIAYDGLPMIRYSAFMNLLDDFVNKMELKKKGSLKLSETIIDSFSTVAKRFGVIPIVAFMMDDPLSTTLIKHCQEKGILGVDISVDLSDPKNTLIPLDPHPSAYAHQKYALRIYDFLMKNDLLELDNNEEEKNRIDSS